MVVAAVVASRPRIENTGVVLADRCTKDACGNVRSSAGEDRAPLSRPASGCLDPAAGALLVPYFSGRGSEEDEITFEAHLLMCDACFRDFQCLGRACNLIRGHRAPVCPTHAEVARDPV